MSEKLYHLKFETRKVQSFIFRLPKLKHMLGANSLLGELFAEKMPIWKAEIDKYDLLCFKQGQDENLTEFDDIYRNFQQGTICSAGGHYEAIFTKIDNITTFLQYTIRHIIDNMPDLQYSYEIREFDEKINFKEFTQIKPYPYNLLTTMPISPFYDCPYFDTSVSAQGGTEEEQDNFNDGINPVLSKNRISYNEEKIKEQYDKFKKRETKDLLALFLNETIDVLKIPKISFDIENLQQATISKKDNMVALITMDGNGMGSRFQEFRKMLEDRNGTILQAFIEIEEFWYRNRKNVRNAMAKAIGNLKDRYPAYFKESLPFVIYMMGGDDIFLLCVPELAFDFVYEFNKSLEGITFSTGMVYVKSSYPISQAHALAESCLSSAKVLSRRIKGEQSDSPATIDWHILYDSQHSEITAIRERDYLLQYNNENDNLIIDILSKKPYSLPDAEGIFNKAKILAERFSKKKMDVMQNSRGKISIRNIEQYFNLAIKQQISIINYYLVNKKVKSKHLNQLISTVPLLMLWI